MNYLAHLFLSGDDPLLRIGNLAGDFVKGIKIATLHPTIQKGIALHRSIDAYTDCHEIVRRSKSRIGPPHARLAGVFVDVFYDHFLAVNWRLYCARPLEEYASEIYADLKTHQKLLPPILQDAAPRMHETDWLAAYRDIEGIAHALHRIERRLKGRFDLAHGIDELKEHYAELNSDFLLFFPAIMAYARGRVDELRLCI